MPKNGQSERDITVGRRALEREGAGLAQLAGGLDQSFADAVARLADIEGRVVVSGMGKSGLVGRKIAATLASVGTPAAFVHPAEASHGDLGMIASGDAILALSNSGDTSELVDLIDYAKRFAIPLIAITGGGASALAEAADTVLLLPDAEEACPMGLAPTTSTTMMMALGDALAVALIERKGFSAEEFQVLHPGGKLSRRLLKVADLMHTGDEMPVVAPDTAMSDTLLVMTERRFGCAGVVDSSGRLVGIITDGDLRRHMSDDLLGQTAGGIMTESPLTVAPRTLASEALGLMNGRRVTSLFVIEDNRPVGILHIHDCLRAGVA